MEKTVRILHIEDVEDDALLALRVIEKAGFNVLHKRVETRDAMVDALQSSIWDVILADYNLPHFGAIEALEVVTLLGLDMPFIVVSGTIGEETAVATMRAGAHDYVMKENLARLPAAIDREIADSKVRADRRKSVEDLFKSEKQLRQKVTQQEALLNINRAVQGMKKPEDLASVAEVCFEQLKYINFRICAVAIQRVIDPVHGLFEFYEIQPTGKLYQFTELAQNIFRIWRKGVTVYRPNLDVDMGGLSAEDREGISKRYGQCLNSILNVSFDLGLLSILSPVTDPFTDEDIAFINQVGVAISLGMHRLKDMEQLEAVVRNLPDGICMFDAYQQLIFANDLGTDYLEKLGIVPGAEEPIEIDGLSLDDLGLTTKDLPLQISLSTDRATTLEVVARPIHKESVVGGWVLVLRDVTQVIEAEMSARRQDRLASVGQLAAGIAHDFNNMLTVMSGFAQILGMNPQLDEQSKEDLAQITQQGQRGAVLVRQILDFCRETDIERQPLDILPFLKESVKLFQRILPETIAVSGEFPSGNYSILANVTQLQQVLNNVAVNAKDAMPQGGKLIFRTNQLTVDRVSPPPVVGMTLGEWLHLSVTDTGEGMTQDVLDHVFEPFFSTKETGKGTGLGLAQVYGLVGNHDGFVDMESKVGEGTTVSLYFPLLLEDDNDEKTTEVIPHGNGECVLVVEDNEDVLRSAQKILEYLNYEVMGANSVDEALPLIFEQGHRIDVILTDLIMPQKSGLDLFKALKERGKPIPLAIMTGYPSEADQFREQIQDTGGLILKPLAVAGVATLINNMLHAVSG